MKFWTYLRTRIVRFSYNCAVLCYCVVYPIVAVKANDIIIFKFLGRGESVPPPLPPSLSVWNPAVLTKQTCHSFQLKQIVLRHDRPQSTYSTKWHNHKYSLWALFPGQAEKTPDESECMVGRCVAGRGLGVASFLSPTQLSVVQYGKWQKAGQGLGMRLVLGYVFEGFESSI